MRHPRAWPSPDTDRTGLSTGGRAVLVVDDDKGVRRLTARMLRSDGYRVLEADSGADALRMLEEDPGIDLVLTDIVMPGMDGFELADRATGRLPGLRVMLMTGHAPQLTALLQDRDLVLPLLLKPFTAEQLSAKVREVLAPEEN
jgi:two-component system, cell cycle sensor histidine kinase and response regulator CckA